MWNGKLDYTFEQWADTIGLQKYELYKMILGLIVDMKQLAMDTANLTLKKLQQHMA